MNKQISVSFVLAYVGWALAFGVVIVAWIVDSDHLGQLGLLVGAVAAACTVRLWMLDCTDDIENTVSIVREVERTDWAPVRPLR